MVVRSTSKLPFWLLCFLGNWNCTSFKPFSSSSRSWCFVLDNVYSWQKFPVTGPLESRTYPDLSYHSPDHFRIDCRLRLWLARVPGHSWRLSCNQTVKWQEVLSRRSQYSREAHSQRWTPIPFLLCLELTAYRFTEAYATLLTQHEVGASWL